MGTPERGLIILKRYDLSGSLRGGTVGGKFNRGTHDITVLGSVALVTRRALGPN